jgi:methyl-accepting chemotaxis protein
VEQVAAILAAMRELEDRFQAIYKMVAMTGEIAEQTELLALNAALEAAGAGLAGQRFMVVADATKRLANRAAEASREIRELVQTIQQATMKTIRIAEGGQDKVAAGGGVMAEAMEAIRSISALADSTSRAVGEITLSTRQQTTGAEQLAGSVAEVHEVARKVEAGAKEIQAAITELQSFAETLRATVEVSKGGRPGAEFS